MKNLFSAATLAILVLGLAVADANQVKKSKSNVSNNKTNSTSGEVCDDGNTTDEDCAKKANKDYTTDPYVEGAAVAPRDHASGMATGKRQHKPMAVSNEAASAPSSQGTGEASATSAPAGTASEGCCPGRCCPPEQSAAATSTPATVGAEGASDGDASSQINAHSDPFKGTNVAKLKQKKQQEASKPSNGDGCCPGRCCPPDAAGADAAGKPTYDLKANKK